MADTSPSAALPPALVATAQIPLLWQQARASLDRQAARIHERTAQFTGRHALLAEIERVAASLGQGLIRIEGLVGSGVTSTLCQFAQTRPSVIWLAEDDAGQGVQALCAQLIGLTNIRVPLVPPAVVSDPRVLEDLLAEAGKEWQGPGPLIVLIDDLLAAYHAQAPTEPIFPARIPQGVVIAYGCVPRATTPSPADACITLEDFPLDAVDLARFFDPLMAATKRNTLLQNSQGNLLYLRFAQDLHCKGLIAEDDLPVGLSALHRAWWSKLDDTERRLALLLAAANEPLPNDLCAELLGADPLLVANRWSSFTDYTSGDPQEDIEGTISFYHNATRAFVVQTARKDVALIHADIASLVQKDFIDARTHEIIRPSAFTRSWEANAYMMHQFARHCFFSPTQQRSLVLPTVAGRTWVRFQQRRGSALAAAHDAAWEQWGASIDGPLGRLARSTFLAGSLATLARTLPIDGPMEALILSLDSPDRDGILKRILAICDQLPDGREKAPLLRRLGEVCYGERRMRTTAMRLLSQALDLEAPTPPKVWRDEREQLLAALARAILERGYWKESLEIATHISHSERRGMVETDVVRALIAQHDLERADLVAHGITHDNLRSWAQAEVAVAKAKSDDIAGADVLLSSIPLTTANAWAQIEVACFQATSDEDAARARIEQLSAEGQRDRGRARLAHVLATLDKDGDALSMAEHIDAVAVRVTALLDLRLTLEGLVAMLALEQATAVISALDGDDRVPLIAALAAAHAALGRRERALSIADQLDPHEERDRALARIAVALGSSGDYVQAQAVINLVNDQDERDWAFDELTRILASAGRWLEAYQSGRSIVDEDQRARTLAEVVIEQARQGDVLAAQEMALTIDHVNERNRALIVLGPLLLRADQRDLALKLQDHFAQPDAKSRYQTALVTGMLDMATHLPTTQAANIWAEARHLALAIARPMERVRALIALADAMIEHNPVLAQSSLGLAMRICANSRGDALRGLEIAAPTFARLGGARLLVELATALGECDTWLIA